MRGNAGLIIGGLGILAMVLLGTLDVASQSSGGQSKSAPGAWMLPDTHAQQAIVRQYLDLLAAGRYADALAAADPIATVGTTARSVHDCLAGARAGVSSRWAAGTVG